jgi:hypothetical protein
MLPMGAKITTLIRGNQHIAWIKNKGRRREAMPPSPFPRY